MSKNRLASYATSVLSGVVLAPAMLIGSPLAAPAVESAMCADINASYASVVLTAGQSAPHRSYSSAQFMTGDVITIIVAAVPGHGGTQLVQVSGQGNPGNPLDTDSIMPTYIGLQEAGTVSATVVDGGQASISIMAFVASAVPPGPDFAFSISCVSAPPAPPPTAAGSVDPLVNVVQQTHTALVARTVSVPGLQQRLGMASGARPGTVSATPGGASGQLNFATSLVDLQNWGAAGDAASALANADPLDQPFNLWIDGSGTVHARTAAGADYWGSFGVLSGGADYLVSRELLVGLAVHGDMMRDTSATTDVHGKGLMVGPYVSAQITENVYLDVAAYYGKSWNDVTSGAFSGRFDTQRWVANGSLKGDMALTEELTFSPIATIFYLRETADAYTLTDGGGATLAGSAFANGQLRLSIGGDLSYAVEMANGGTLTPLAGARLGLSSDGVTQHTFGTLTTGLSYSTGHNATIGAQIEAAADSSSLRALTARTTASVSF